MSTLLILKEKPDIPTLAERSSAFAGSQALAVRAATAALAILREHPEIDLRRDGTMKPTLILHKPYQPRQLRRTAGWVLQPSN
jgi:hypothetical protein